MAVEQEWLLKSEEELIPEISEIQNRISSKLSYIDNIARDNPNSSIDRGDVFDLKRIVSSMPININSSLLLKIIESEINRRSAYTGGLSSNSFRTMLMYLKGYYEKADCQAVLSLQWLFDRYSSDTVLELIRKAHDETSGETTEYGIIVNSATNQRIGAVRELSPVHIDHSSSKVATVTDIIWLIYQRYKEDETYAKMPLDWQFEALKGL